MNVNYILELANDNLVMEPLDALVTACAMLGHGVDAPKTWQDDDMSLDRVVNGAVFHFNGEQWEHNHYRPEFR